MDKKQQKDNSGVAFVNDYKKEERHPDMKGRALIDGKNKDVAIWYNKTKDGKTYLSFKYSEPYEPSELPKEIKSTPDDLPF